MVKTLLLGTLLKLTSAHEKKSRGILMPITEDDIKKLTIIQFIRKLFEHLTLSAWIWLLSGLMVIGTAIYVFGIHIGKTSAEKTSNTPQYGLVNSPHLSEKNDGCPSNTLEIVELADRALRNTKNCGDRDILEKLKACLSSPDIANLHAEITKQIKRVEIDYRNNSLFVSRIDALPEVCQLGSFNGNTCEVEPSEGYNAINVVNHLDSEQFPNCPTRARALALLRNIKTSFNKADINMTDIISRIIFILKNDDSLLVSKLALDRYSQFTGYNPIGVLNFDDAIRDWENKISQKSQILLPEFCFQNTCKP